MSITEELRAGGKHAPVSDTRWFGEDELLVIADRIDKEHKKAVERARMDGMDVTFGNGWVKLPVDADGVSIKLGDELTNGEDLPAKVRCMVLDESGWMASTRDLRGYGVPPATLRHVKPDSWERIMDDAEKLARGDNAAVMELVERCRRLAGERG